VVASVLVCGLLAVQLIKRDVELVATGLACDSSRPLETCYTPVERSFLKAATAARELPAGSIIMAQREAAFAYHSGHPGVYAYEAVSRDPAKFLDFLGENHVSHVVLSRITRNEPVTLGARLEGVCDQLDIVGEFGEGTFLLRVRPQAEGPDPARRSCPVLSELVAESTRIRQERLLNPDVFSVPDRERP
jgi:hypothetical protein